LYEFFCVITVVPFLAICYLIASFLFGVWFFACGLLVMRFFVMRSNGWALRWLFSAGLSAVVILSNRVVRLADGLCAFLLWVCVVNVPVLANA